MQITRVEMTLVYFFLICNNKISGIIIFSDINLIRSVTYE